jgi:hypothetical protein
VLLLLLALLLLLPLSPPVRGRGLLLWRQLLLVWVV